VAAKGIDALIIDVDPAFKDLTASRFDEASGEGELSFEQPGRCTRAAPMQQDRYRRLNLRLRSNARSLAWTHVQRSLCQLHAGQAVDLAGVIAGRCAISRPQR
jgi:hypothetical protein